MFVIDNGNYQITIPRCAQNFTSNDVFNDLNFWRLHFDLFQFCFVNFSRESLMIFNLRRSHLNQDIFNFAQFRDIFTFLLFSTLGKVSKTLVCNNFQLKFYRFMNNVNEKEKFKSFRMPQNSNEFDVHSFMARNQLRNVFHFQQHKLIFSSLLSTHLSRESEHEREKISHSTAAYIGISAAWCCASGAEWIRKRS